MFEKAKKLVIASKKIYIVGHVEPDGDSIGAAFSLCLALKAMGKDANVVISKYGGIFSFLPYIDTHVKNIEEDEYDLLIGVDCSDKERLDIDSKDFDKALHVIMLDHHMLSHPFGEIRCIDSTLPAVSELVYNFISYLGVAINKDIASYIYAGLVTDSGSFNYSSTKPSTLRIAANLIETGIDFSYICKMLTDTVKEAKLKLISETIENMEAYFDGKLRFSFIPYKDIKKFGLLDCDAEGMTNYLRMVEGTEVAIYVREKEDGILKVSMRSNGYIDVSKVAISFGGGGHCRAAGYTMKDTLQVGKKKIIDMLEVMLK
ncbi:MAG: bifunctional oligoribonuclease/PAP phosphatase NrnA [Clostridia bacterium]